MRAAAVRLALVLVALARAALAQVSPKLVVLARLVLVVSQVGPVQERLVRGVGVGLGVRGPGLLCCASRLTRSTTYRRRIPGTVRRQRRELDGLRVQGGQRAQGRRRELDGARPVVSGGLRRRLSRRSRLGKQLPRPRFLTYR